MYNNTKYNNTQQNTSSQYHMKKLPKTTQNNAYLNKATYKYNKSITRIYINKVKYYNTYYI